MMHSLDERLVYGAFRVGAPTCMRGCKGPGGTVFGCKWLRRRADSKQRLAGLLAAPRGARTVACGGGLGTHTSMHRPCRPAGAGHGLGPAA